LRYESNFRDAILSTLGQCKEITLSMETGTSCLVGTSLSSDYLVSCVNQVFSYCIGGAGFIASEENVLQSPLVGLNGTEKFVASLTVDDAFETACLTTLEKRLVKANQYREEFAKKLVH